MEGEVHFIYVFLSRGNSELRSDDVTIISNNNLAG